MQRHFEAIAAIAAELGDLRTQRLVVAIADWLTHSGCHVVVCGEFKRGKSTLVNALVGAALCPTDVLPATAVPMVLAYGESARAVIEFTDGRQEAIAATREELGRLTVGSEFPLETVRLIRVWLPSPLLREGFVLVDTPGVNDLSQQRAEVTYGFLPVADAAIVVLDATAPLTRSEAEFLGEQVLPAMRDRMLFLLGKRDRLDDEELDEATTGARARLADVLGQAPELLAVSALLASRGEAAELAPLREALLATKEQVRDHRGALAKTRLQGLAHQLRGELASRLQATEVSEQELMQARVRLGQLQQEMSGQYEALREYVELYGHKTLRELVAASLRQHREDLEEELLHQLDLLDGKVEEFVHKRVPFVMAKAVRRWSELKGMEIQQFLELLTARVASDFAAAFAVPLELAGMPRAIETPEFRAARSAEVASDVQQQVLMQMLPTALPMAAGAMLLGPVGSAVGLVVGSAMGASLREARLQAQKTEAAEAIARDVAIVFDHFDSALGDSIDRWFDQFIQILRHGLHQRSEVAVRALSAGKEADRVSLMRLQDRLEACLAALDQEAHDERLLSQRV